MGTTVLNMIKSKKFQVTLFSILAVVFTALSGQITWADAVNTAWPIVVAYLGAQGLADFGKSKASQEK